MEVPKFLKKTRELPLKKRRIIFWVIILICGVILFFLWVWHVQNIIKDFSAEGFLEEINLPELQKELEKGPSTNIEDL